MKDYTSATIPLPNLSTSSPLPRAVLEADKQEGSAAPVICWAPPLAPRAVTWQEETQLQAEVSQPQLRARQLPTGRFSCPGEGGQPASPGDCVRRMAGDQLDGSRLHQQEEHLLKPTGEDHGQSSAHWDLTSLQPHHSTDPWKETAFQA